MPTLLGPSATAPPPGDPAEGVHETSLLASRSIVAVLTRRFCAQMTRDVEVEAAPLDMQSRCGDERGQSTRLGEAAGDEEESEDGVEASKLSLAQGL